LLNKIQKGERVNGIEKDPLLSAETDIVVEYNNVPGFLRRETSTQGDDKLRIAPHDGGVDTVKNVLDKFRKKKEEIQQKKLISQQKLKEEEIKEEDQEHIEDEPVIAEELKEDVKAEVATEVETVLI